MRVFVCGRFGGCGARRLSRHAAERPSVRRALAPPNCSMERKSSCASHARTPLRCAPLRRVRASPALSAVGQTGARVGATQLGGSAHLAPRQAAQLGLQFGVILNVVRNLCLA